MEDIVKDLKDYMARENIKRYELARRLNTTEANITNWLNKKRSVSMAWCRIIREFLKNKNSTI